MRIPLTLGLALCTALTACDSTNSTPVTDAGPLDVPGRDVATDGSTAPTDGGTDGSTDGSTDGGTPQGGVRITHCPGESAMPPSTGVCQVTPGTGGTLLQGDVLTPGEVFRGGQVLVNAMGVIQCVGCDCATAAAGATRVVCPRGVISPGLINAHDHLTFVQNSPYTVTPERYEHRHDWRRGLRGHTRLSSMGSASNDQMAYGELRFVMGGGTSVNGSGGTNGYLRNLDRTSGMEGLNQMLVHYQTFPLGDSGGEQLTTGCSYPAMDTAAEIMPYDSYAPHIAEGINVEARNEFLCVREGTNNLIQRQTAVIHGVGLVPSDIQLMAERGTKLIWSPRSNVTLYGDTARVTEFARLGVPIALGSDWLISGSMNMLRELRCADGLNSNFFDHYFSDEALWLMATRNAAVAMAMDDVIGTLAVGRVADIAIFNAAMHRDHRAVIDAGAADVALVLRGGTVLYGEATTVAALPGGMMCDTLDVCGSPKRVCVASQTPGRTLMSLQAANMGRYPLFFCGEPMNEPSCLPARNAMGSAPNPVVSGSTRYAGMSTADDMDGDGVPNAMDLCPRVFDPVRPLDMGRQGDADRDMIGDACDPCPLNAGSTCRMLDSNDRDGDGVPNAMDNCPDAPNTDQLDTDRDMIGDACDPCPMAPNSAGSACPATIYAIKSGMVMVGARVTVTGPVVTAVGRNGFYVQTVMGDMGYMGPDRSGVYVFTNAAPTVMPGDRVTLTNATVADYFGQTQLTGATIMTTSRGATLPTPVVITGAEGATGGARATALEGVLVRVESVDVLNGMPMPAGGDMAPTNEFEITGGLRVDDGLYLATPLPMTGESFTSITGILALSRSNSKLNPRSAADYVGGSTNVLPFAPGPYFVRVSTTAGPTIPTALTVVLSRPAAMPTMVTLTTSGPGLTVTSPLTIPMGMDRGVVQLTGVTASDTPVMVTAAVTTGRTTSMQTASVRVIDPMVVPGLASITAASMSTAIGGTVRLTVALDAPAPMAGLDVLLSVDMGGTIPMMVHFAPDQVTADVTFTAGMAAATSTITARLGMTMRTATIMVTAVPTFTGLVLNEIDYDQVGDDTEEFVELYNSGTDPVDLSQVALVLVNGADSREYFRLRLSGTLMPGAYAVAANTAVMLPAGVARFNLPDGTIQNGAPDGVLLLNVMTSRVLDALSYEGSITAATVTGVMGAQNLVEGTALPVMTADSNTMIGSLARSPNGRDTNNASMDWRFATTLSPGAANP